MRGLQLYIDAGHGGDDPGAVVPVLKGPAWAGDFGGPRMIHEAELTAGAALAIEQLAQDFRVKAFSGPTGLPAAERVTHIREWGENVKAGGELPVVMSVHWNMAEDPCTSGCEVLLHPDAAGAVVEVAKDVAAYLAGNFSWHFPIHNRGVQRADLEVLSVYPQSSMQLDVAFLSNAFECFWWAKFGRDEGPGHPLLAHAILVPIMKRWGVE